MGKGLCIGLAIGFLAGWVVFGLVPGSTPVPRAPVAGSAPGVPVPEAPPHSAGSGPPFFLRDAPVEELQPYLLDRDVPFGDEALPILAARLDAARAAGDWELFRTILGLLAKLKTAAAQEKLVAVMDDETLSFKDPQGGFFWSALRESGIGGIPEAARRRFDVERARKGPPHDLSRWLRLVALHGDAEDLEWLDRLRGERDQGQGVLDAYRDASANELAAQRLVHFYREERGVPRQVAARAVGLLWQCPSVGFDFYREEIPKAERPVTRDFLRAFGRCITAERLDEAKRFLRDLREPHLRVQAVYVVETLQRRGLDVSGLEPLVHAPVDELERLGREGTDADASWAYDPMYAVAYNRVTWSERAAAALEAAAARIPRRSDDLLEIANGIRAGLRGDGPWR